MKKIILSALIGGLVVLASGCSTTQEVVNKKEYDPAPIGKKILWSTNEKRPGWSVSQQNYSDGEKHYFVGASEKMPTEKTSRSVAEINARANASKFIGSKATVNETAEEKTIGKLGDTASGSFKLSKKEKINSETLVSQLSVEDYYTVMWEDKNGKEFWQTYVLMSLPVSAFNSATDFNAPQESKNYEYLDSIGAYDRFEGVDPKALTGKQGKGMSSEPLTVGKEAAMIDSKFTKVKAKSF